MLIFSERIEIVRVEGEVVWVINDQPYTREQARSLSWAQVGTTVILASEGVAPRSLKREDTGDFTFGELEFSPAPVLDQNRTNAKIKTNAKALGVGTTATLTLTPDGSVYRFSQGMVGGTFAISEPSGSLSHYTVWHAGALTKDRYYTVEDRLYLTKTSGTAKSPPTHEFGTVTIDKIQYVFQNKGTGYVKITSYTSPTVLTGVVIITLPPEANESNGTLFWNEGAFSPLRGYPRAVTFFQDRLVFGGSDQSISTLATPVPVGTTQRLWASQTGTHINFDSSGGLETRAIAVDLLAKKNNKITWLASTDRLIVGTQNGIFPLESLTDVGQTAAGFGGRNVSDSCSDVQPLLLNNLVIFNPFTKNGLKATLFNDEAQAFQSQALSFRNEAIFRNILTIASLQEPTNQAAALKDDGRLAMLYFDVTQQIVGAYEIVIDHEEITSICSLGSKLFVGTQSGRLGVLDLAAAPVTVYEDFGQISEAYVKTLPVGTAVAGQVTGFFNDVRIGEVRIDYFNTQALGVDEGGDLIGRRASQGEESPLQSGFAKTTIAQKNSNESIKIKSLAAASLAIRTLGIVYSANN